MSNEPFFMQRMNALNNNPLNGNRKGVTFNNNQKPATPSNNALLALQRQPARSSLKQVPRLNIGNSTNQSAVALHEEVLANAEANAEATRKKKNGNNMRAWQKELTNKMFRGEITINQMRKMRENRQMQNARKGGKRRTLKRILKRKH